MKQVTLVGPAAQILNEVATSVGNDELQEPGTQQLIDAMLAVAQGEQGNPTKRTLVGLAAPQVGASKRIIVVGTDAKGDGSVPNLEVFINPRIMEQSDRQILGREGCYSTGAVCGAVERAESVKISALNRYGERISRHYEGFVARIFQHEIDHLNGIRFPDRITDPKRLHWVDPEVFGDYRTRWQTWTKLCPRQKWLTIKKTTEE
jgi:peptide deformylase